MRGNNGYGCVVGGGTVTYGASSWRHLPWEFDEVSTFGSIPGADLADWPITYEELEPYYTQAEWEIGVSGLRQPDNSPFFAPMSKAYPVPPQPEKSSGALLRVGAAKLGWTVVPNVAAIITKPYNGRMACNNCGMCSGYACQVKARSSFGGGAYSAVAIATGKCEVRANSYVREISVDNSGKATGRGLFRGQQRQPRSVPEGQGGHRQRQRHRHAAHATAVQVEPLPERPGAIRTAWWAATS